MNMMKIEVVPDPSVTTGGHAIIRLKGVALLPPGATFRIDPIDEALADVDGWPYGDLRPLESRQTPEGLELRIGPSVVDAPLLEPGVPVVITVDDAQFSAEIVWPSIPVSTGAATAPVVMSASQMAAEFAAAERAKAEAKRLATELEAKRERLLLETEDAARRDAAVPTTIAVTPAPAPVIHSEPVTLLNGIDHSPMRAAARELDAVLASDALIAEPRPDVPFERTSHPGPADALSALSSAPLAQPRSDDVDALSRLQRKLGDSPPAAPDHRRDAPLPAILVKQASEAAKSSIDPSAALPAIPDRRGSGLVPFLGGAVVASGGLLAAIFAGLIPGVILGASTPPVRPVIADAFMAGPQSPRGETAASIDLPTALRLADQHLHGIERPIDRAEAEFWLKKALSLTASHTQLRWAMTQLGTLAAQPVSGLPDYEKARLLWEISAANGDPIALCFLGTLAENGLGAPADRGKALEYYKRSKEIGGCPTSDEAIARLSR